MRIPIRMIGIATTFFWIFLVAFFISAVYSVKDLHLAFGEPQMSITVDNEVVFSLPAVIENRGFYNIAFLTIETEITDEKGFTITQGSTVVPIINKNENVTITHNMTINVTDLFRSNQNYLFNDTEVRVHAAVSMRVAEVIPVQLSTNLSVPWGAPLCNFSLGEAEYTDYNSTHFRVVVPISFENHALFDLTGEIQICIYNSTDVLLGDGQTAIEVQQNSPYNGGVELYVPMEGWTESGRFEVYFQTPLFDHGPLVIPYG